MDPTVVSPTSNKASPFDTKPVSSSTKPSSPEAAASSTPVDEDQEAEQPGTPVPEEDSEASDNDEKPNALSNPRREEENLNKEGKKRKRVHWAEEEQLKHCFYFDLDETERVNVNKRSQAKAKRKLMTDQHTFEMSHDAMEERVPWTPPRPLMLAGSLVTYGANSTEKLTQRDREMGILQEIYLSKDSVPDSPHEPDPEPYEPMPPRLIPLDEDLSMVDDGYAEPMDTSSQQGSSQACNPKLPPVLPNHMVNLSISSSSRSPQTSNTSTSNAAAPSVNVQELLTSTMGASGSQSTEELLGSLQQSQNRGGALPHRGPGSRRGPGLQRPRKGRATRRTR